MPEEIKQPEVVTEEWLAAHPDSALQVGDAIPTTDAVGIKLEDGEEQKDEEIEEEKKDDIAPPVEQGSVDDTEPRLRYRGQIVLSTTERTVGVQTFKHIACGNGTEFDLSEQEYRTEVIVSYPPHN